MSTHDTEAESKQARADSVARQLDDSAPGQPGQTASPADEQAARAEQQSDTEPETPKGVGESTTRHGEEVRDDDGVERGRHDGEVDPEARRQSGTSDPDAATGVGA